MPNPTPLSPLAAFLRGIEARAFILIQAQCGDAEVALRALTAAEADFARAARVLPLTQWPLYFWGAVLLQPDLTSSRMIEPPLADLSSGPRAALLLRLLAGLDAAHAAQALGVAGPVYDRALERALADLERQSVSPQDLHDRLHARAKDLSPAQTEALAAARAAACALKPELTPRRATAPAMRWRPWTLVAASLAAAALLASVFWPAHRALAPGQSVALSEEDVATVPALTDTAIVMHPDYAQLAAPADDALAQRLALWSWMAAGSDEAHTAAPAALPEVTGPESAGSDPDADEQGAP